MASPPTRVTPRTSSPCSAPLYQTDASESGTHLCPPQMCPRHSSLTDRLAPALSAGLSTAGEESFPFGLANTAADELNRKFAPVNAPSRQVESFPRRDQGDKEGAR